MLLEPESRAALVEGQDVQLSKEHTFLSLCFSSSTALHPSHSACWCADLKLAELCQWPPSEYILVYWWMQGKSWDLYSYESTYIQLFLVLIIVCMLHHFKGIDVGVDGRITSPRNSPIDSVQELQRICCLWPPPIISAWNHRFVKVSTTFDKHQLDPFQMCCLNLKVAPNWWEGRMVGSQKSISSPLIICFASSLAKVSENFQVQGLNSDFRWSMAMCS